MRVPVIVGTRRIFLAVPVECGKKIKKTFALRKIAKRQEVIVALHHDKHPGFRLGLVHELERRISLRGVDKNIAFTKIWQHALNLEPCVRPAYSPHIADRIIRKRFGNDPGIQSVAHGTAGKKDHLLLIRIQNQPVHVLRKMRVVIGQDMARRLRGIDMHGPDRALKGGIRDNGDIVEKVNLRDLALGKRMSLHGFYVLRHHQRVNNRFFDALRPDHGNSLPVNLPGDHQSVQRYFSFVGSQPDAACFRVIFICKGRRVCPFCPFAVQCQPFFHGNPASKPYMLPAAIRLCVPSEQGKAFPDNVIALRRIRPNMMRQIRRFREKCA